MSKSRKGEKNHKAKITEIIACGIKLDLQNGMRNCDVTRKYRVTKHVVNNIKTGRSWGWLNVREA
jgi:hypothetical protein